jgi:hypothetical protein
LRIVSYIKTNEVPGPSIRVLLLLAAASHTYKLEEKLLLLFMALRKCRCCRSMSRTSATSASSSIYCRTSCVTSSSSGAAAAGATSWAVQAAAALAFPNAFGGARFHCHGFVSGWRGFLGAVRAASHCRGSRVVVAISLARRGWSFSVFVCGCYVCLIAGPAVFLSLAVVVCWGAFRRAFGAVEPVPLLGCLVAISQQSRPC